MTTLSVSPFFSKARLVALAVVSIAFIAIGFLPLFGGTGYEHGIASGVIVPTIVAIVASFEGFVDSRAGDPPIDVVIRGIVTGLFLAGASLTTAIAHGVRVGTCDLLGGIATFVAGSGVGCVLAGTLGALSAILVGHTTWKRKRRIGMLLAGISPLVSALVAGATFYFTPAIFAFDPFVGFFSGTLYDEVVDAWAPLLTYRAGTFLSLCAVVSAVAGYDRSQQGKLTRALGRAPKVFRFGALVFAVGSFTLAFFGAKLGHRTTAGHLRDSLGASQTGPRCEVIFPRGTPEHEVKTLLRDCEEQLSAVEQRLGARGPEHITAYFFRDSAQKRALIGAADTYIAKPWRHEVYLQILPYPHPVLGHELAHVVGAAFGRGPFRIAGSFGGLLPNPGLVEGLAVAASPDRDELTAQQWARAMKQLDLLPPLTNIFGSGFLAQNSATAYTVAGAFVGFLLDEGKSPGVRAWYGGSKFEEAFGESFASAETRFRQSLDSVILPNESLAVAKARFDRPAIWGRPCPHVVERLRDQAEECRDEGDHSRADAKLKALLELDPHDAAARLERGKLAFLRADPLDGETLLRAVIQDVKTPLPYRLRARETLADEWLRQGKLEQARTMYDEMRPLLLDEDYARTIDVKRYATTSQTRARLFGRLLVGTLVRRDDSQAAMLSLARSFEHPPSDFEPADNALTRYLLARKLHEMRAYDEATVMLREVDLSLLATVSPRLSRESGRLEVMAACHAPKETRKAQVDTAARRYREAPIGNLGRRTYIERIAQRCSLAF